MRWIISFIFAFQTAAFAAGGSSTIDPTQPAFGSGLTSAIIRNQFLAAISDINALIKNNAGTAAPTSPALGQMWLNTSVNPYLLQQWDGAAWVTVGSIDPIAHTFNVDGHPIGTSGATIPLNNSNNTSSGNQTHSGTENFTGPFQIGGAAVTLPVPVAIGGTGATTAWQARNALCPGRTIPSGASDTATTADCGINWNSATTSAKAQTIPACNSGNDGYKISVTDEIGTARTYNITVTPVSGTILKDTGLLISGSFWSFTFRCDGANTNYTVL